MTTGATRMLPGSSHSSRPVGPLVTVAAAALLLLLVVASGSEGASIRQPAPIRIVMVEPFTDTVCFAMEADLSGTILTKEGMRFNFTADAIYGESVPLMPSTTFIRVEGNCDAGAGAQRVTIKFAPLIVDGVAGAFSLRARSPTEESKWTLGATFRWQRGKRWAWWMDHYELHAEVPSRSGPDMFKLEEASFVMSSFVGIEWSAQHNMIPSLGYGYTCSSGVDMPLVPMRTLGDKDTGGSVEVSEASVVLKDLRLVPFIRIEAAQFTSIDGHWDTDTYKCLDDLRADVLGSFARHGVFVGVTALLAFCVGCCCYACCARKREEREEH